MQVSSGDYLIIGLLFIAVILFAGAAIGSGVGALVDLSMGTFPFWTIRGGIIGLGTSIVAAGGFVLTKLA